MVTSFGIPIYEVDGFEADDIIGTIAKKADTDVIIVTGDRDLLQLIDDHIKVFMPVKGLSEGKVFDEVSAVEKFGVPPNKIPDYKGLAGDASDNYPGVAGIGPKTAIKLINQYGSIEKIIESGALGDKAKSALLSKNLATIRIDAPIEVSFDKMKVATLITPQSRMKLAEFGFKTLLKRLSGESDVQKLEKPKKVSVDKPKKTEEEQLTFV
jgi:DNA polymerase-1